MKTRRCLFLPFVLLLIALLAPSASAQTGVAVRALAAGGPHPLPVAGARVTVVQDGRTVARGRTGSQGIALLRGGRARPGVLRVVVAGGHLHGRAFRGQLVAVARSYRWPRTLHVNPVTTLAVGFAASHRRLPADRAARRTRSFLRLPDGYVLGRDGRAAGAFDGRRFLAAARRAGGFDRFVARLVRAMGRPSAHRAFRHVRGAHPGKRASASVLPGENPVESVREVSEAIESGSGFFEALEKTDYVLDFADAVLSITGVGDEAASAAELQELSSQLQVVEEGLSELRGEVDELREKFSRSAYSVQAQQNTLTYRAVETGEDELQTALQLARQNGCNGRAPNPRGCREVAEYMKGFVAEFAEAGPHTAAAVNAYAGEIAGSALASSPPGEEGLVQLASALVAAPGQGFFTEADSERLAAISGSWASSYAQALILAPTYWLLSGSEPSVVRGRVAQIVDVAGEMPAALPKQLPVGTVLDLVHANMWPTRASAHGTTYPWSWFQQNQGWKFSGAGAGKWVSTASGAEVAAFATPNAATLPYEDWRVAGLEQIQPLVEMVKPQAGESSGEALLAATGLERDVVIPEYGAQAGEGGGRGLEFQDQVQEVPLALYRELSEEERSDGGYQLNSSCFNSKVLCFWPVWIGDGAAIGNLNGAGEEFGVGAGWSYRYREAKFEPSNVFGDRPLLWGLYEGSYFGNDPVDNIPNLFYRPVAAGECLFYPQPGVPAADSPGCRG